MVSVLGVTLAKDHRLIALPWRGRPGFPAWQFAGTDPDDRACLSRAHWGLVDGGGVDPWSAASWFLSPHPATTRIRMRSPANYNARIPACAGACAMTSVSDSSVSPGSGSVDPRIPPHPGIPPTETQRIPAELVERACRIFGYEALLICEAMSRQWHRLHRPAMRRDRGKTALTA